MVENLIDQMKKIYKDFEIDDKTFKDLYHNAMVNTEVNNFVSVEYRLYLEFKKCIDDYIMKQIQDGNELYQLILAYTKKYVIQRYFNLKPMNINIEYISFKYENIKVEERLQKFYEDVSDMITEELKENYDYSSTLDKQYVKQLNNKFNK